MKELTKEAQENIKNPTTTKCEPHTLGDCEECGEDEPTATSQAHAEAQRKIVAALCGESSDNVQSTTKCEPYTLEVCVSLIYKIDAGQFPPWATPDGVVKLANDAFDDYNRTLDLKTFGAEGIFKQAPVEVSLVRITT